MSDARESAWAARKAARGSSRSCNPETEFTAGHASRDAEAAMLQRHYDEAMEMAATVVGNGVKARDELRRMRDERDAALAVIAKAAKFEDTALDMGFYRIVGHMRAILESAPVDALAEHDRGVVKSALHKFADRLSGDYALDQSSPTALLAHIVSLARRDGGAL